MQTGTIKFYHLGKSYGFVTPDEGGSDIYLPGGALMAANISGLQAGQRVSFEQGPDARGPKIVALQLLDDAIVETPVRLLLRMTVLCDANAECLADLSAALRTAGFVPELQDIVSRPLSADELRRLSHLMAGSSESLVRRHDALFYALQLDDRFIGDQEFWTAVSEHPALINGPILAHEGCARVCKSGKDVAAFLSHPDKDETAKRKPLPNGWRRSSAASHYRRQWQSRSAKK